MRKNKKGFTLVELVIVIAVIAILAAVLLPTFATVIENAKISSATQKAQNALKDFFTRVATISTTDQVDVIGDLEDYILVVENGEGAVDYGFIVNKDGSLSFYGKGSHTANPATKTGDYDLTTIEEAGTLTKLIDSTDFGGAKAVDPNGCTTGIDGLNGVVIYQNLGRNTIAQPLK